MKYKITTFENFSYLLPYFIIINAFVDKNLIFSYTVVLVAIEKSKTFYR